jgi:type VI protein secretion system component VasK
MTQELLKVESISEVLQTAPDILQRNELSVSKCNAAGQTLLDTVEANDGITSDAMDEKVKDYIEKTKVTVTNMNGRRKPITQLLTAISKRFTSLEAEIDLKNEAGAAFRLQEHRNRYAAKKLAEQQRREEEARRIKLAEDEKVSYRDAILAKLHAAYSRYEGYAASSANALFNRMTLESFDRDRELINQQGIPIEMDWAEFCKLVKDDIQTSFIAQETKNEIKHELVKVYKKQFAERFHATMHNLKTDIIERLPSKFKALEEEAELRLKNAEEAARATTERLQREAEEAARAEAERKAAQAQVAAKAEAERKAAEAMNALNFMQQVTPDTQINAKVAKKIEVLNPRGFVEIYTLWFMKEGCKLSMTDLEKIHKKMITFCEKEANRDGGETIKSAFIKYVNDVKAK